MPTDPFKKVKSGDELRISASLWNRIISAVVSLEAQNQLGTDAALVNGSQQQLVVRVKNIGTVEIPRFRPCSLESSLFIPSTQSIELPLINALTITGRTTAEVSGRVPQVGITLETIQPGAMGRAAMTGYVHTTLDVGDALHDSADVVPGQTRLATCYGGVYPVVWKDTGTGEKSAIISLERRLGIVVRAGKVTAAPSGETAIESCTYSIQPTGLTSSSLLTSVTPWRPTSFAAGTLMFPASVGDDVLLIDFPIAAGGVTTRALLAERVASEVCE